MNNIDGEKLDRLYQRLALQKINAFFCVVTDSIAAQREIAADIAGRFPDGHVQAIDFYHTGNDFRFSSYALRSLVAAETRVLFLVNFQLAVGDMSDEEFFQILNLSRDNLEEFPLVLVFMMPLYFRTAIARRAPDFNSFFRYQEDFVTKDVAVGAVQEMEISYDEYNPANIALQEYYRGEFDSLKDHESREALDVVINILKLNASVRVLHHAELYRFFDLFKQLVLVNEKDLDDAAFDIARVFYIHSEYDNALIWYQKDLTAKLSLFGEEHLKIAAIYHNIAIVYDEQGDCSKALAWFQKAIYIREKELGKKHPVTADTYNNVAIAYGKQGDYDEAMEWFQKALEIYEIVFGKTHIYTADTYNNIAIVYASQSKYEEALEWHEKALEIKEKQLGNEHPGTAGTYMNMANVYSKQGDYLKALEWYLKALKIDEKTLGKKHPSTASTYRNMALAYKALGDPTKAAEWQQKAEAAQTLQ